MGERQATRRARRAFFTLGISMVLAVGVVLSGASAGTITGPGSAAVKAKDLTAAERKALRIVSVRATGMQQAGMVVTVTFAGNIERSLGRGHLERAVVALVLRPKSGGFGTADVASQGPGWLGDTLTKTRSTTVGVVRIGRTLTFFVGGPGAENVGKIQVKAFAVSPFGGKRKMQSARASEVSPEEWERLEQDLASDESLFPAPSAETSCDELASMKEGFANWLALERQRKAKVEELRKQLSETIPKLESDLSSAEWGAFGANLAALAAGAATPVVMTGLAATNPVGAGVGGGVLFSSYLAALKGAHDAKDKIQVARDAIRSAKLDLRLAEAFSTKIDALIEKLNRLDGLVDGLVVARCGKPGVTPITAVFTASTVPGCKPPACTTVYTERATGTNLGFTWLLDIPADPDCRKGFAAFSPRVSQATWFHADVSEGGTCNHTGKLYDPVTGHPGTITVTVSNDAWECSAVYHGTMTGTGDPFDPEKDCVQR